MLLFKHFEIFWGALLVQPDQNWNLMPNCSCRGEVPGASAVTWPAFAVPIVRPDGASQFCTLNVLKDSNRSWRFHPSFGSGIVLNSDVSILNTPGPLKALRPRFPNEPEGTTNAHGLKKVAELPIASGALPPCDTAAPQPGSGFAATGPGLNGSPTRLGRA